MVTLRALIQKNAVEKVNNQTFLTGFLQQTFLDSKT